MTDMMTDEKWSVDINIVRKDELHTLLGRYISFQRKMRFFRLSCKMDKILTHDIKGRMFFSSEV